MKSLRRGSGTDVAGSRPYRPGDDMDSIDWAASARLSTARAPTSSSSASGSPKKRRRSSSSAIGVRRWRATAPPLPWLDKPMAMRTVVELVLASAGAAGGFVGYLDYADGDPHWRQPKGERKLIEMRDERLWSSEYGGPAGLARALDRSSRGAHARRHPGHVRLRALRLRPGAVPRDLARRDRASVGCGADRHPGSDLGAELSRRRAGSSSRCATRGRAG